MQIQESVCTPRMGIQVLARMCALLDALARSDAPLALRELSAQTALHPSTAHRILDDLVLARHVERTGPGTYRLGLGLLALGRLVRARLDVRQAALAPMRELQQALGCAVSLCVCRGDALLCVECTGSDGVMAVGESLALHDAPAGRLWLAPDDAGGAPDVQIAGIYNDEATLVATLAARSNDARLPEALRAAARKVCAALGYEPAQEASSSAATASHTHCA